MRFYSSLRRGDVLLLTHISTVSKKYSNTSNTDNVVGNSNITCINVHAKSPRNKLITLQKQTDTESSTSINDEIMDNNNTSEVISSHQNLVEVIDHTCDNNGTDLLNIE